MVYLLSRKGTLHKVTKTDSGLLTFEADNIDQAKSTVYGMLSLVPAQQIKKMCARCFPPGVAA
jgi:hypothetical protein